MFSSAELEILLRARDEASKVLTQAEGRLGTFAKSMDRFVRPALLATSISAGALVGAVGLFVNAAMEGEVSGARLEQAIRNTGMAFDATTEESVDRFVKSLENMSGFSDNEVRDALSLLISETGDLEEAMKRERIAADFARGAHLTLYDASKLLGKVTDETVEVLSRYGIHVDKNTTATELFALVQERFADQAVKYADTIEGKWAKVQNRFRDFLETTGASLLPYLDILLTKTEEWEASEMPRVTSAITDLVSKNPQVIEAGGAFLAASAGLMALAAAGALLTATMSSPVVTIGLVAIALYKVYENAKLVTDNWDKMGEALHRGDIIKALQSTITPLAPIIGVWGTLAQKFQDVYDAIMKVNHVEVKAPDVPAAGFRSTREETNNQLSAGAAPGGWGAPKSSADRIATLDDIYAAYTRNHGVQPNYDTAARILATRPYWSDVQGLEAGGVVSARPGGTLFRLGEGQSDEVVAPLDRYSVVPRGTSGGGLVFNNYGTIIGIDDMREFIAQSIRGISVAGGFRGLPVGR